MVQLPRAHFGNYNPASFGWTRASDIVDFSYAGVAFPVGVNRRAVPLFTALLERLVPLMPNGLMTPGCWGFHDRSVTTGGSPSFHAYGLAVDINAPRNPMLTDGRTRFDIDHEMPHNAGDIAAELGMEWGGQWTYPVDLMHFEIHLDPDGADHVAAQLDGSAAPRPTEEEDPDMAYLVWNSEKTTSPLLLTGGKIAIIVDPESVDQWEKAGAKRVVQTDRDFKQIKARMS